jgi:hypothetical protein
MESRDSAFFVLYRGGRARVRGFWRIKRLFLTTAPPKTAHVCALEFLHL